MCSVCDDTGWKPVTVDGVRRVVRCDCWQSEHAQRLFDDARIPPRYRRCDFENFQVYRQNEKLAIAVRRSSASPKSFPGVTKGLCLIGPHGIGKTHLAVAALRAPRSRAATRRPFYEVSDLLRLIRSTYNPVTKTAEMEILQPLLYVAAAGARRRRQGEDLRVGRGDDDLHRQLPLQPPAARRSSRRTTRTIPTIEALDSLARAGRLADVLAHARDVRFHRLRRRRLPAAAAQRRRRRPDDDSGRSPASSAARLPNRTKGMVRAQLKHPGGKADLGWTGGKAGS